ncbi:MAG: SdpI family protein [Flavobacteriaceae bacterium]|nr:SdpI family protein [Flavobacteriaceae bacterium]MDG2385862.1 SdpI family protein [Flavobacteriaceae bacterium]
MVFEWNNPLSLILSSTGLIFYLAGWIQGKYPPKKRNHFYGYRTKISMKNLEVWNYAQQYSAVEIKKLSRILILLAVLAALFPFKGMSAIWIGFTATLLAPIGMVFKVEKELKKRFP